MVRLGLVLLVFLLSAMPAAAHDAMPAYLEVRELANGRYETLWKRPTRGDLALGISVRWPDRCAGVSPAIPQPVPGAEVSRQILDCGAAGMIGQRIVIEHLRETGADALVRIVFRDGSAQTNLVTASTPDIEVVGPRPAGAVAAEYFVLGVEHILWGVDHLLFVLGLTLIVRGAVLLVKTITAFTVAHSITLALAALGVVNVPQAPVEAVIALSILFLARELVRQSRGETGLTARAPWLVAFVFGLLHGFGFAGALSEIGLPETDIPLALLAFNLGVEAGQLMFVAAVLAVLWAGRRLVAAPPRRLPELPAYAIGSLAALWLIERVAAFG